tara:strand:+ start:2080 stop:2640 length:561 start_codon:yes stop_codon:yes gene_type:complete
MPNYLNGKVYKIVDNTNGNIYIGSTAEPTLARRLAGHVGAYNRKVKTGKGSNCKSYEIMKNGDYRIVLIDTCPCHSKDELNSREQEHMDQNDCVNQIKAHRTPAQLKEYQKQYRVDNQDKHKAYDKSYREEHLEKKNQYMNNWRKDNETKLREYDKRRSAYQISWGGDKRTNNHNNLLNIDPNLFQ